MNDDLNSMIERILTERLRYFFISKPQIAYNEHAKFAQKLSKKTDNNKIIIKCIDYTEKLSNDFLKAGLKSKYFDFNVEYEIKRIRDLTGSLANNSSGIEIYVINNIDFILSYFRAKENNSLSIFSNDIISRSTNRNIALFLVSEHLIPDIKFKEKTYQYIKLKEALQNILLED